MKQGDPMFPMLYNSGVDKVFSEVDGSTGTTGDAKENPKSNAITVRLQTIAC